jgi:putative ABC transport system ATP-binding protein
MEKKYLTIKNLTKIYNPDTPDEIVALDDITFSVSEGEFVTIVGSNAAGKSTLFGLITGSLLPTAGEVILDNKSICYLPEHKKAKIISCVRQNPDTSIIGSMTIAENLAMVKLKNKRVSLRKGVKSEWKQVFATMLKPLNLGLEKRLDEKMNNLSGGQKQTVALLMATLTQPKLLLLDEHTASLDPKVSRSMLKITDKIVHQNKVTTLMITHNIRHAIEYGSRLILFNHGKIGFEVSGMAKKSLKTHELEAYFKSAYDV